ncbi:MAG: phage tail assembly protein [Desulfamplus sp.]
MSVDTEFEFELPQGYVDTSGSIHKKGIMRLARAKDEIDPMRDMRVRANNAYLTIILLSRVITRLGELKDVNPGVIEELFAVDFAYLQAFYRQINETGTSVIEKACPKCGATVEVDLAQLGGE